MKSELQNKLYHKYPKIFAQKDLDSSKTCMCWGISCDNGWYALIDMLCFQLQFNTDKNGYPQVEAVQVKEKFGTLRFYYNTIEFEGKEHTDRQYGEIDGLVSFAEFLSGYFCEVCGTNQNVIRTSGWIKTICNDCLNKGK
jgi:hypothetical protein